jgi:hypothetical protein
MCGIAGAFRFGTDRQPVDAAVVARLNHSVTAASRSSTRARLERSR